MSNNVRSIRPEQIAGQVEISDSRLVIRNLETTSDDVIRSIEGLLIGNTNLNAAAAVSSLLDMGAMVYQLGSTSADIERMQSTTRDLSRSFESTTSDAIKQFTTTVDSLVNPEQGLLSRVAEETVVKTRESINSLFIGADATVPQEILSKVNEKLDSFSKEIHRIIGQASTTIGNTLSMDSGTSPLQALKNDLITSYQDLNKQLTDKIDAVKAKVESIDTRRQLIMNSTKKGLPYEDSVFEVISQFATASGDEALRTGQSAGLIKNCMKGDVTLAVNKLAARGHVVNVVFEAKSTAMSREEWRKELNIAMSNRAAEVSVAVVQFMDQMPSKSRVSIQDNQQLMVAFDPETDDPAVLGCIYNIAKAYAVSRSLEGTQVSFKVIQEALEHLQSSLSDLESIEGAVRTARKSLEKIDSARIGIKGTIENQSQRLSSLIGSNVEEEAANA
jgi:prefoldin subunit 5